MEHTEAYLARYNNEPMGQSKLSDEKILRDVEHTMYFIHYM